MILYQHKGGFLWETSEIRTAAASRVNRAVSRLRSAAAYRRRITAVITTAEMAWVYLFYWLYCTFCSAEMITTEAEASLEGFSKEELQSKVIVEVG